MAGANSNIQITDLDFNLIKTNLKTFLQSQNVLQDYNYEGSALSTLLDILAYNTQYQAYYLNMVANEMFLDSALKRSSVVSHAKLLNYTPASAIAPQASIDLVMNNVTVGSLTIPKFTSFLSEAIDGVNYRFVTLNSVTENTDINNNTVTFNNLTIKQGEPVTLSFTYDAAANPTGIFELPDTNIDTTTISVVVQQNSSNNSSEVFNLVSNYLSLDPQTPAFFLQEGVNGFYQIYFGDDILGKSLVDGNVVNVSYIITSGVAAAGANNFVLMDTISGFSQSTITPITAATEGSDRESIESIKYQATKSYAAQGRAVTKEDYITAIQQNRLGFAFDAVNVWGGEQNDPPVYGQVFICLKPSGSFTLTQTQKQRIVQEIIKPISVLTVEPTLVDPDYTYIKINTSVLYDPKKTTLTANQIQQLVTTSINNFATSTLNTFNSTFSVADLIVAIKGADPSIVSNDVTIQLQKKFNPNLVNSQTYKLYFGSPLNRGLFQSGVSSSPALQFRDPVNRTNIIDGVYIEEVPSSTGGIESISLLNAGYGYQLPPIVTISGDGSGARAEAEININGTIRAINVTAAGNNYTSAIATITPAPGDTTGQLGAATVMVEGQFGTLRSYYNNSSFAKTIFGTNVGTIDYVNGVVTLDSFNPVGVDNPLGQLTITATPQTTIISSTYSRIITIDPFDPTAISVNVTAKR